MAADIFEAFEAGISSGNPKTSVETYNRLHAVASEVNALVNITEGSPQVTSDAIIKLLDNSLEKLEAVPELEEKDFRINSDGWEVTVGNDGIRYKINPQRDVTEVLEGDYAGDQHFLTETAALRETKAAEKEYPDYTQWQRIIEEGEKRAQEKNIPLYKELGLNLGGSRVWSTGQYGNQGAAGYYWSSSSPNSTYSYYAFFPSGGGGIAYYNNRGDGFSVRCLKKKN